MSKPLLKAEIHRFLRYEQSRKALEHFFAPLRPWTYMLTLTYRPYERRKPADCDRDILDWAKACQKNKALGGRFEYVFAAEYIDPLEPPHLHGLVYLEAGRSRGARRLLYSAWRERHGVIRTKAVREAYGAASYIFKDYSVDQPMYASVSLNRPLPYCLQSPALPGLPEAYYARKTH